MRLALPLLVALALSIPATAVVAFPKVLPEPIGPTTFPASGPTHDEAGHAGGHRGAAPRGDADGHDSHAGHAAAASPSEHTHARERTAWPPAEGAIPASTGRLVEVERILIQGSPDHTELEEMGVELAGSGTLADPYVLEGLWVKDELEIKDTEEYYVVRNNVVDGTLRLNWNDDRVHVHHNKLRDLRVNENIERVGEATGGLIELNAIGVVGQIRHFDGVFRANEVGPVPRGFFDAIIEDSGLLTPFVDARAMNIDGFDGAIFEENTFLGYVEMQLHGHHHASCFDCHSHNHAVAKGRGHDHTIRYHEADFRANRIVVEDGIAFRFTDAAHSGDDRTATSEPNEALKKPHVHFTRLAIEDNVVEGGPMVVDILNADSRDHANEETDEVEAVSVFPTHAYRAQMSVARNTVSYTPASDGIRVPWFDERIHDGLLVRDVKEARVDIAGNIITLVAAQQQRAPLAGLPTFGLLGPEDAPAALHLREARAATLVVSGNELTGAHFGILVQELAEDVELVEEDNAIEAEEATREE